MNILCIIIITNYIKFKIRLRSNAAALTDKFPLLSSLLVPLLLNPPSQPSLSLSSSLHSFDFLDLSVYPIVKYKHFS